MTEREFWIAFRAALLLMVDAIEKKYELGKHAPPRTSTIDIADNWTHTV